MRLPQIGQPTLSLSTCHMTRIVGFLNPAGSSRCIVNTMPIQMKWLAMLLGPVV
jgi:hypothetical protein